ncbi:hypothetical protein CONPUDRAFT_33822, partial [Coniophora puteana RWD-64-598 SS2]
EREPDFLDSVEGEISFFRSVSRARPIGVHRHFHVLAIRNAILRDTGHPLKVERIWEKLRECYDLDGLDGFHVNESAFESPSSSHSNSPQPGERERVSPSENLFIHPHFHKEYALPHDEALEAIVVERRMRDTPSIPSSSRSASPTPQTPAATEKEAGGAPTPAAGGTGRGRGGRRGKGRGRGADRAKGRVDMAGLVAGDSDSSALTQESADEGPPATSRGSATGTDGTEYAEDDEPEVQE